MGCGHGSLCGTGSHDDVPTVGFHCFTAGPCVLHACVLLVDFGTPGRGGGLEVRAGGLLIRDHHGVVRALRGIAVGIPDAARHMAEAEHRIMSAYSSAQFSLENRMEA